MKHGSHKNKITTGGVSTCDMPMIDIREIKSVAEVRMILEPAHVIFAVQRGQEQNRSIVFGKQWLRTIAEGLVGRQRRALIGIVIDFATEELEQLVAAVQVVKGFHEYEPRRTER